MDEPKLNLSEEESDNESITDINNENEDDYDEDVDAVDDSESAQSNISDDDDESELGEESNEDDNNGDDNIDEGDEDLADEDDVDKNDSQQEFDDIDSDSDDDEELYLFDDNMKENLIADNHPLLRINNMNEIKTLSIVTRDVNYNVIDEHHKTIPILTKYEKAKVLGIRANQLNNGCKPFVNTTESDMDGYLIAERELQEKKMPLIIKRPLPSGKNEYWKVNDLELII